MASACAQAQSNSRLRTAVVKAVHAWGVTVSVALVGCLESRTATAERVAVTSTQLDVSVLRLLFRQWAVLRSGANTVRSSPPSARALGGQRGDELDCCGGCKG